MILHSLAIQIRAELRVRLSLNSTDASSYQLALVYFCDDVHRKLFIHTFFIVPFRVRRRDQDEDIYAYTPPGHTPFPKATADTAHSAHRQHCGHTAPPSKGREKIPRTRWPHSIGLCSPLERRALNKYTHIYIYIHIHVHKYMHTSGCVYNCI